MIRAFLALEIPDTVKHEIETGLGTVRDDLPPSRWVRLQALHLTLKFLGDVETGRLRALTAALAPSLESLGAVDIQLHGVGFFPSPARARVAWLGGTVKGVRPVVEAVEAAAVRQGFARERRRWALHLTLARIKKPWPPAAIARFTRWGEGLSLSPFEAAEVVVVQSELRPTGAVYTDLERMPLT